jgi:hypothetical protein
MSGEIDKKDLFDAIKHGHVWHMQKIVDYLNEFQKKLGNDVAYMHEIKWDANEKIHYIYCNEYSLFISDGFIEIRCEIDNHPDAFKEIKYPINKEYDLVKIYNEFVKNTLGEQ